MVVVEDLMEPTLVELKLVKGVLVVAVAEPEVMK